MTRTTISQADLSRNPQEVVERVRQGAVAVIETGGAEQMVILDPLDFQLLHALGQCALVEVEREPGDGADPAVDVLQAYLADTVSLGRAADLLGVPRLDLQRRFHQLGIPLRLGPATLEEALSEARVALQAD